MSLQKKISFIAIVAWLLVMAAVLIQSYFVILPDYENLEHNDIKTYYTRTQEAIGRTVEALNLLVVDWAHWNDTYEFMKDKNEAYIKDNIFNLRTYQDTGLNFILFYDDNSKFFTGSAFDPQKKEFTDISKNLLNYLEGHKTILKHDNVEDFAGGFIYLPEGYALLSSYSITNGEATEKPNGNIVMGYYFNAASIKKLSETLQMQLSLIPLNEIKDDAELKTSLQELESGQEFFSVLHNDTLIHIYTLFNDINKNLIGLLRIDMPRATYLRGLETIHTYIMIMGIVGIIIVGLIGILLKYFILNRITFYKNQLKNITSTKDFSKKLMISGRDEISSMVDDSNKMLTVINDTQGKLNESIDNLTEANTQLNNEIIERKKVEKKVAKLNNKLVVAARRAGMADIATSVLHNIGNVLNSTNTAVSLLNEKITHSKAESLKKVSDILQQHKDDLGHFLANDPGGKNIPNFINVLSEELTNEKTSLMNDVDLLNKNVQHIKSIINMQYGMSNTLTVMENVNISEMLENAILINKSDELTKIEIIRDYEPIKTVHSDQVKLLQIFVNLIKNAIESLLESNVEPKRLTLRVKEKDAGHFSVQISDNGVGIESENVVKVFSHGYTTKKTGHGFGLHTSALSAQDMGGILTAESKGKGYGATFTLTLPYESKQGEAHAGKESEAHTDH